jgi:hypothetical protein
MSVVILASICNEVDLRILFRGLSVQWITKLKLQVSSELSARLNSAPSLLLKIVITCL